MKKIITILSLLSVFTLTGCFNPVFYEIRKDVKPEPKTIYSPINQITRFTFNGEECLFIAADKGIRYKKADSASHDTWKVLSGLPFSLPNYDFDKEKHLGEQIIGVYADETHLYVLTVKYTNDTKFGVTAPEQIQIHVLNSDNTWEKGLIENKDDKVLFPIYKGQGNYYSSFAMFQTNSVNPANREVYLRVGAPETTGESNPVKYYKLTGTSFGSDIAATVNTNLVDGDATHSCARSAVNVNGTTYFFNAWAATTNDSETKFYYSSGTTVKSGTGVNKDTDNKDLNESHVNVGKKISALAFCNDALLIGCGDYNASLSSAKNGGIYKTSITAGVPGNSLTSFSTNAQFQITSAYYVTTLFNATPDKPETESSLYCGTQVYGTDSSTSASFEKVGLWSYYPGRGNWNRE